jgi:hypothetical protein
MKLGYRPQYTLGEALPDVVRWYDANAASQETTGLA